MSRSGGESASLVLKLALRAFPSRFRRRHGADLVLAYSDYRESGRRRAGRLGAVWDLFRNGMGARLDDLRPPREPRLPEPRRSRATAVDSIWGDVRFALRMLRKAPAFTAVAVVSLAVGIGGNTAIFSVVDAALFRSLDVPDADELVVLGWLSPAGTELPDISTWGWYLTDDEGNGLSSSYSIPAYEALRDRNEVLASTFAFASISRLNVRFGDRAELADAQVVSGNYYGSLGVQPLLGRFIVEDDDRADADAVTVLSHGYWQRRFGSDPGIVGRTLLLNGARFTVVGVAPATFRGTLQVGDSPEITLALAHQPLVATSARDMTLPENWWLHLMGRLRSDVSLDAAEENLNAVFHSSVANDLFAGTVPGAFTLPDVDLRPGFQGMTEQRGVMRTPLRIMGAVVGLVLLIACANVANLLMARSGTRRREIAVRLSIGAGRGRLVRQLLAESVVLSMLAGGVGVAIAVFGREALLAAVLPRELFVEGIRTDARMLAFGVVASLVTGILFGVAPALRASRTDLTPALRQAAGDSDGRGGGLWGPRTLLVAQVAMSVVLLVTAGLFVRSVMNLQDEATGFDPEGVAILRVDPGLNGYDGARQLALYEGLRERMKAIPGVVAATTTNHSPVSGRVSFTTLKVAGFEPADGEPMRTFYNFVGPEFFDTFRIPLVRGRGIEATDREGSGMVAVINETMAERYFPGEDPIGRRLGLGRAGDPAEYEIVGVAANVKYQRLQDDEYAAAHIAVAQHAEGLEPMTLALRTSADPGDAIAAAAELVRQVDANLPVFGMRTLEEQQADTLELEHLFARLSVVLGALALGLSCIGLYGILSYGIVRRTREIGVRMALGARRGDVMRLVMTELGSVALGAGIGLASAFLLTRYLQSLLYGLSSNDPASFGFATVLLLGVASLAAWLPARRAAAVDPVVALRFDG